MWTGFCCALLTAAAGGKGTASLAAGFEHRAAQVPLALVIGVVGGAVVTAAAFRMRRRSFLLAVDDRLMSMAEVEAVHRQGYDIGFRRFRPTRKYQKWMFKARWQGRTVGRLDVDFMEAQKWLYVDNVHVVEAHVRRGLGTALLLCAAKTTGCTVLTSSSRTRQGASFFEKNRLVLHQYGVEMRDRAP